MKLRNKETQEYIELPLVGEFTLESSERIDVRPGETLRIKTNLELLADKVNDARIVGYTNLGWDVPSVTEEELYGRSYQEIEVEVHNPVGAKTIMVFPGDAIAMLRYTKIAKLESEATFYEDDPEE